MLYRHSKCGRLSRIYGECEECTREAMQEFWVASPLPCGHDNSGIPWNTSFLGVCDICAFEWMNIARKQDEERKTALKRKIIFNRTKKHVEHNNTIE